MGLRTGRFRRADRLLRSAEFRRVGREGRRGRSAFFVALTTRPALDQDVVTSPRLGVTVSRRVGNAVMRNRVKRRVREWFRRERHRLAAGAEVVVIARPGAAALETPEVAAGLEAALRNELEPARS